MRSVRFAEAGKPADVLRVEEVPMPEPKPGEVRIRVHVSPINPSDISFIQNQYGIKPQFPSGAGFEGMGTIDAIGEEVSQKMGTRMSFTTIGAWSQYVTVPAKTIIPIPDALPDETAAQLFVNPFTAYAMVQESGVQPGGWLLLTAAGSAFGQMVIQLCKMKGIRTIGTVRRNDMIARLKELGADEIINTEEEKLPKRVMEITSSKGVPCVLDAVGGKTGASALQSLAYGGTMLVYGLLSLENIPVNSGLMIFKALHIRGFWLTDWMRHAEENKRTEVRETVIELLASGKVKLPVEKVYPLEQIKQAVTHADAPGRTGKILLSL
ncbi:zinc-dependent alcohol dehydrogenase family protein [Rhodocytophaga rosea]|uniref:Zinc-dependent alcohol dehydrogenase family protein n=1 Tax=Rhodocytophaga rosea TaxID=2704465 RepID=A0A6C0GX19_9BACT|nr:zinc-dependent alcohol dehydrogenase family protein [Rhodocytophaga rosea]